MHGSSYQWAYFICFKMVLYRYMLKKIISYLSKKETFVTMLPSPKCCFMLKLFVVDT